MGWRQVEGQFGTLVHVVPRFYKTKGRVIIEQLMESCVDNWIRVDGAIGCPLIRFDSIRAVASILHLVPIDEKVRVTVRLESTTATTLMPRYT